MNLINQIPPDIEWRIYKGDISTLSIFLFDSEDNPIDLTGYTINSQARRTAEDSLVVSPISSTINENLVVLTIPNNTILPALSYFDVQATSAEGDVKTLLRGSIIREQDVTR